MTLASSALRTHAAPSRGRGRAHPAAKPVVSAVMYARVSSKDQEKEGFSIPAQQKLLRSYAEQNGIHIEAEYTDIETAKKAGRTSFGEMLAFLRAHPSCRTILVEKTDRLYRNLKDWVELDAMNLDVHLVKENVILSDGSRSGEKFIHGIKVLMAKNYIDNLSEEVRKGMREKAEQGIWPSRAPMGLANVLRGDGKRGIALDPIKGPVVKRMFEQYATGGFTLQDIAADAARNGLLGARGKAPLTIGVVHQMFHNPLYKGEYVWNGEWRQGTHTPLVTPELWTRVQEIMASRGSAGPCPQKHQFAFNGLVHCGDCAAIGDIRLLVGEIQKGKYIYYHCAGCQRRKRKAPFVREQTLDAAFVTLLGRLHLDDDVLAWLKSALAMSHEEEKRFHAEALQRLQHQFDTIQRRIEVAYDDRLDGRLDIDAYTERSNRWRQEQAQLRREMERHDGADRAYMEDGIALLELAGMALELYEVQSASEKRRMLDFLCLNSEFRDGVLTVEWRKPFDQLSESIGSAKGGGVVFSEENDAHPLWRPRRDLNA